MKKIPHILSIQSHVATGYVGNRAAVFPMQRLGCDVSFINTVQFSNHTGYGKWTGQVFSAEHIQDIVQGLWDLKTLDRVDGILSGYLGAADIGHAILKTVTDIKQKNPNALYCCDPVIGDQDRGIYVRPGIPEFMKEHAITQADILTPNQFELAYLTNRKLNTLVDILGACDELHARGPSIILVTSLNYKDISSNKIGMLLSSKEGAWLIVTPRFHFDKAPTGSGDLVAAIFFAHYLINQDVVAALEAATGAVYGIFAATHASDSRELTLISAQEEIVKPSYSFSAGKIR